MLNGTPVAVTPACSADKPPPISRTMAINPSTTHQKIRCGTGASILPPAVIVSTTSEPESEDVTKNTSASTIAMVDAVLVNGSSFNMPNRLSSGE